MNLEIPALIHFFDCCGFPRTYGLSELTEAISQDVVSLPTIRSWYMAFAIEKMTLVTTMDQEEN
jgi:hypothetical protein